MSTELQELQSFLKQTVGYNGKDDGIFDPIMVNKCSDLEKQIKDRLAGTIYESEAKDLTILSGETLVTPLNKLISIYTKANSVDLLIKKSQILLKGKNLLGNNYSGDVDGKMNPTFIRYLQDLERAISSAANISISGRIYTGGKLGTTAEDIINAVHLIESNKKEAETSKEIPQTPTII